MTAQHTTTNSGVDDTRQRILAVALELIAAHGFAATSTREISARLGFTKAALYYHFRTKDDLLAALVAPATAQLAALVEGAHIDPSTATRRRLLAGYVDFVSTHLNLIRVLSQDPSVAHCEPLRATEPLYARLTQLLSGLEEPGVAQRTRVRAALGGIHTALLRAEPADDPSAVRNAALSAACGALGIRAPGHPRPSPISRAHSSANTARAGKALR